MGGEEIKAMGLKAGEEGGEEVTWVKLLPRASVRVLLVERDDSTRQIITALLRKCGYRVTTASDGLKAWEILKEKDHNIDLVLTEVELPKMSGIALLTMMMDQDCCKHIPVIMMSSNDSISIAFKCLIKGAADFLVKPIRKNELTNLWQHVWRKQKGENNATQKKIVDLDYDHCSIEDATDKQYDKDFCEKESDAQSSCTRSDMEVESTCKLGDTIALKQAQCRNFSLFDETKNPDSHFEKQLDGMSLFPIDEANGVISLGSDIQPEGKTNGQELDQDDSVTGIFDLIEVINNKPRHISSPGDSSVENFLVDIDLEKKSSSMPSLELSLDRYPHVIPNDESNTLHHSNSSAFSLYNNNRRVVVPELSKLTRFQAQNKGSCNNSIEPPPYQFAVSPPHYNGLSELDDTKIMDSALSRQAGTTFRCTPIRCIPFPVPVGGVSFDDTGSNPFLQSIFYPQSARSLWSAMPSNLQEAFTENLPHQSSFNDFKSVQCHQAYVSQEDTEQVDEQRHVQTATVDSASVCNESSRPVATFDICEASARSGDEECFQTLGQIKSADTYQLSQREAALTKFRLKRKERCFEKKVRYLSRQKLAEQRPRVKGQFVRQV